MNYTGSWPPVRLVRFQPDHFFPHSWWLSSAETHTKSPVKLHTHVASALVGKMPPHFETSEMVVNSVKESLQSLPSELHHLNYFPFIKRLTGKLKLVPAARHNGQESRYSCRWGRLLSGHSFGIKMLSKAMSEQLNSKIFWGSMPPDPPTCYMFSISN